MNDSNGQEPLTDHLRVGEVAERAGVSPDTVRYYEKRDLLDEPPRFESSGYRAYPPEAVERVQFVQNAKAIGFSLDEIAELLELRADDTASCHEVREVARNKADELKKKIERLERMLEGLESMTDLCPGDVPAGRCPLLDALTD